MNKLGMTLKKNRSIIVILLLITLFLLTLYYQTNERIINKTYNGIKFQSNNYNSIDNLIVEIRGTYSKGFLGKADMFEGNLYIDGEKCYSKLGNGTRGNKYSFSKEQMSYIETDSFEGFIFADDYMDGFTITIDKVKDTNDSIYSFSDGWLISAPCDNRNDAVAISNQLIQKLHKDVVIK